jgi:hypothetical protein
MKRARILCHLLLCTLPLISQAATAPLEVLDARVVKGPAAACVTARHVTFDGRDELIRTNTIISSDGVTQLRTDDPILDAAWRDGHEYVLTSRELLIISSGTRQTIKVRLPAQSNRGRLLATSPAFVSFSLARGQTAAIIGLTAQSLQVVAVETHYSASAIDLAGNILVAADTDLYAISRAGRRVPLLRTSNAHIRSIDILPDNSLLIGTSTGLLKLASNRRVYPLLSGIGELRRVGNEYAWCTTNSSFALRGLELPGTPGSDKQEVALLLRQAGDDINSHRAQAAYRKARLALQILPEDAALKELVSKLRRVVKHDDPSAIKPTRLS